MEAIKKRTAFRYKSDTDELLDQSPDEGMDEQEQENLISTLSTQDEATTAFYRKVFLALPAACLFYFFVAMIMQPRPAGNFITNFLSLISLLLSLGTAYKIPVSAATQMQNTNAAGSLSDIGIRLPAEWEGVANKVLNNLVLLNTAVCVVLFISVITLTDTSDAEGMGSVDYSVISVLLCFVIVATAKRELRPVDIPSLERLKYIYKGA